MTPTSPLRVLGTMAIAIFIGEFIGDALVMGILAILPPISAIPEVFIDATMLIVVISPALYLFMFQPIIRQVKQRENAEQHVRKSNTLLQTIFNGISDPLVLMDKDLKVMMINKAAGEYYQIKDQFIDGKPCHTLFMCEDEPCPECEIVRQMEKNTNHVFERKGLFDPSRTEQVVIYRSDDQYNHLGAAILKITDVTEAKALERQMHQRERLASLGLLISGVAHEINNPNTFISFNLPILMDYLHEIVPIIDAYADTHEGFEVANMPYAQFKEDLFKLIKNITHGSRRIDNIVSQLKEFSRLRDVRTLSEVNIASCLDKAVMLATSQIKRMTRNFEMVVPPDLPPFVTDSQAIEQIVLNLLINACQAVDKSDSWVRLRAYPASREPYALCLEISDNGCGMDEFTLKHIFDPLFTTKGSSTGTGLGLYVCHNLVDGLGGEIAVETKVGEGSTFKVTIPDLRNQESRTGGSVEIATPLDQNS